MAADFVMDDGSSSSGESFTTSAGNGRHGSVNGGAGFGVNNLPDVYQFSATSSAERAVAAAAAWEHGLRGPEAAVSNGNAHNPLLSQVGGFVARSMDVCFTFCEIKVGLSVRCRFNLVSTDFC